MKKQIYRFLLQPQSNVVGVVLRRLIEFLICKESWGCIHIYNIKSSSTPASTVTLKIMKIDETLIFIFLHLEV